MSAAVQPVVPCPLEPGLRQRLHIPADAKRVLIFGESSHWDTNWMYTSEEYFHDHIEAIFPAIIEALRHDRHRVYAIESIFFLKMFWERHPEHQSTLRELLEGRQLRLLGASLTTPDTLLPSTEAILRDYLLGQKWLTDNGLSLTPNIAYFPDNFGHSPALPALMQSLGITGVGITRVDGMYFIASDYRRRKAFPLVGSTAEQLERQYKSLDFIWRSADGASVLCHWNAFTYFQGDMLAHSGIIRWMGKTFGIARRSGAHIAHRLRRYVNQLGPLSPTPYMFCPIGCDFNRPIAHIGALLRRYNHEVYPLTGVYAVSGALDDYLDLIAHHRDKLPELACDPNPYWMGFYASRPEVKQRPMRISKTLLLAERLAVQKAKDPAFDEHMRRAWTVLALSNHHDYITGTSPDRVFRGEQRQWLDEAEASARAAWSRLANDATLASAVIASGPAAAIQVKRDADIIGIEGPHYRLTLTPSRGGCLTSFIDSDGRELLAGVGFDLVVHRDSGGLWRMGHEFAGGSFAAIARASDAPAQVTVHQTATEVVVELRQTLLGCLFRRTLTCRTDSPFIWLHVEGVAKSRWTVTCRFESQLRATRLIMDTPGGQIDRPTEKIHDPTFWPVSSRCLINDVPVSDDRAERRVHICFDTPGALAFNRSGAFEWVVARNVPKEKAYGILPVLAHPIGGTSPEIQSFDTAVCVEPAGASKHMSAYRRSVEKHWLPSQEQTAWDTAVDWISCDDPRVSLSVAKHAEDGDGFIVRLLTGDCRVDQVHLKTVGWTLQSAELANAREQNRQTLPVCDSGVQVPMQGSIVTVRLHGLRS